VAAPAALFAFVILAPLIDRSRSAGGIWFSRDRFFLNALFAAILVSQIAFIVIGQWLRGKNWELILPF
jgi:hypothetical protein